MIDVLHHFLACSADSLETSADSLETEPCSAKSNKETRLQRTMSKQASKLAAAGSSTSDASRITASRSYTQANKKQHRVVAFYIHRILLLPWDCPELLESLLCGEEAAMINMAEKLFVYASDWGLGMTFTQVCNDLLNEILHIDLALHGGEEAAGGQATSTARTSAAARRGPTRRAKTKAARAAAQTRGVELCWPAAVNVLQSWVQDEDAGQSVA